MRMAGIFPNPFAGSLPSSSLTWRIFRGKLYHYPGAPVLAAGADFRYPG